MPTTQSTEAPTLKSRVFVTGASGYIGFAVCRAFIRAGYTVYGLVRNSDSADKLTAEEITPVIGSISLDLSFADELLSQKSMPPFDVIVSCTEQIPFDEHWKHVLSLLTKLALHAQSHGIMPLVLMSSGCKDYGMTLRHNEPGLTPHTEKSPLQPVDLIKQRTLCTLKVFEHKDLFDAVVIRPTPLYGYGSSYYGVMFEAFSQLKQSAAESGGRPQVRVPGHPDNIYHGCHVDDCAEAYVCLASHPDRSQVNGECFNVSARRYETVAEITAALIAEYNIEITTTTTTDDDDDVADELRPLDAVLGYTQWVDSTKIRALTGWSDSHPLFSENVRVYRAAYEAAARSGDASVARIKNRVAGWVASGLKFGEK